MLDKSYFLSSEMNFATLLKSKDKHKELQGFVSAHSTKETQDVCKEGT